jgi:hypothetical protein
MISVRTKRALFVLGFLFVIVFVACLSFAFLVSRDVPFDWEHANVVEARLAQSKLRFYDEAVRNGDQGYIRLSELEINSYLKHFLTNSPGTNAEPKAATSTKLHQVGVSLTKTNLILYSWGERRFAGLLPLRFVLQREFALRTANSKHWEFPPHSMHVGNLEVAPKYWHYLQPTIDELDAPLADRFSWITNVQAVLVTKNELSQRPELRLYNYNPFAARQTSSNH